MNVRFIELKPENVTADIWQIVIEAWENGLSDREAAFRVCKLTGKKLTAGDIQKWYVENGDIEDLRASLQSDLLTLSKLTIADALREGDIKTAKWYAERKGADEFSTKSAVAFEGAVVALSLEEKEQAAKDFLERFENGE